MEIMYYSGTMQNMMGQQAPQQMQQQSSPANPYAGQGYVSPTPIAQMQNPSGITGIAPPSDFSQIPQWAQSYYNSFAPSWAQAEGSGQQEYQNRSFNGWQDMVSQYGGGNMDWTPYAYRQGSGWDNSLGDTNDPMSAARVYSGSQGGLGLDPTKYNFMQASQQLGQGTYGGPAGPGGAYYDPITGVHRSGPQQGSFGSPRYNNVGF